MTDIERVEQMMRSLHGLTMPAPQEREEQAREARRIQVEEAAEVLKMLETAGAKIFKVRLEKMLESRNLPPERYIIAGENTSEVAGTMLAADAGYRLAVQQILRFFSECDTIIREEAKTKDLS